MLFKLLFFYNLCIQKIIVDLYNLKVFLQNKDM